MKDNDMKKKVREDTPRTNTKKKRRIVLWTVLGLVLAGVALGGWHAYRILKQPASLFAQAPAATAIPQATILAPAFPVHTAVPTSEPETATPAPSSAPEATAAPAAATPEPTATPKPVERLNILLMGIDAFESGGTTSGSMAHTDAIMLIAINFDENKVDLISLARDTMTTAPGHYGIYKLNGVFNVGIGGWSRPTGAHDEFSDGFLLTCRAAEEWMGGISIPYYYALDFQAVIDIVDAIGGIDYDLDIPITSSYAFGTRSYAPGKRHLDGVAVMGYLRTRYGVTDALDSARTTRQRRMMMAIFNKLKNESKLSQIPALINAVNSGIYTNTTLSQTTALANYASKLDADHIQTHSMIGDIGDIEYDWRYVYVDQQNRLDIIREVFGIEAEPVGTCTRQYERWLHTVGFSAMKYMRQAEKVLNKVQELKDAGTAFTEEQIALYGDCYQAYAALKEGFDSATDTLSNRYAFTSWREKKNSQKNWTSENKAVDQELSALEADILQRMTDLKAASKDATIRLSDAIGFKARLTWNVPIDWFKDPDINEVIVAFG